MLGFKRGLSICSALCKNKLMTVPVVNRFSPVNLRWANRYFMSSTQPSNLKSNSTSNINVKGQGTQEDLKQKDPV